MSITPNRKSSYIRPSAIGYFFFAQYWLLVYSMRCRWLGHEFAGRNHTKGRPVIGDYPENRTRKFRESRATVNTNSQTRNKARSLKQKRRKSNRAFHAPERLTECYSIGEILWSSHSISDVWTCQLNSQKYTNSVTNP